METDTRVLRETESTDTGRWQSWIGQSRSFYGRYARELFRNKTVLFWSILFPVGFYLLTITVFVDLSEIPSEAQPAVLGSTAISYGTFGAIIVCLNTFGQQLAADFEADRYKQFRALPIAPTADLAGRMAAGLTLAVVAIAAVIAVSVPTGAEFVVRSPASLLIGGLAVLSLGVVWMVVATLVATTVTDERYASIITVALALLSYMLTGYNGTAPGDYAGPDFLLNYLPNTLPTRLLVYNFVDVPAEVLAPPTLPSTEWGLGLMVGYSLLALGVGVLVMRRSVYGPGVIR
jgi:ABC-2 type transport system permease protein